MERSGGKIDPMRSRLPKEIDPSAAN